MVKVKVEENIPPLLITHETNLDKPCQYIAQPDILLFER